MTTKQDIITAAAEAASKVIHCHYHVASTCGDLCLQCGKDLRDDVHLRQGENSAEKTNLMKIEAALNATPLWELLEFYRVRRIATSTEQTTIAVKNKLAALAPESEG